MDESRWLGSNRYDNNKSMRSISANLDVTNILLLITSHHMR
jgi:hypothetical protein